MCNRIAIIDKGNLVALDTTEKLLERIKTKKIRLKVANFDLNKNSSLKFENEVEKYCYMWKETGEYAKKKP